MAKKEKKTVINGYTLESNFTTAGAGMCQWAFAKKNDEEFFIKQFISVKYPVETAQLSADMISRMKQKADEFKSKKLKLYQALYASRTGNILIPIEFFRNKAFYYLVTEKVNGPF